MSPQVSADTLVVVAVVGLVGVVAGAFVTGLVNLRIETVKERRENAAWLREKIWRTCVELNEAAQGIFRLGARRKSGEVVPVQEWHPAALQFTNTVNALSYLVYDSENYLGAARAYAHSAGQFVKHGTSDCEDAMFENHERLQNEIADIVQACVARRPRTFSARWWGNRRISRRRRR